MIIVFPQFMQLLKFCKICGILFSQNLNIYVNNFLQTIKD
jgi:hypothetical protein